MNYSKLANLIFPNINLTVLDLENKYPARNLKEGAKVTRFAPSPTGFLHTGSLFTSMIAKKIAHDSKGIFYTRLEDTDSKREIEGSGNLLIKQLKEFDLYPDEGYLGNNEEGIYGPYKQSFRKEIYQVVIKDMINKGIAYPCFLSEEDLVNLRKKQEENKEITGVYGKYAIYRDLSEEEYINLINEGRRYVIRFKSQGNFNNKIKIKDEIRGELELSQNEQDVIIMKSDKLPTYHFAHVVDDHFMHTNLVTRGEEWLSSLPIHLELFKALNFKAPKYAHLPVIMKLENNNKRKLSKRKDPEASVEYFLKEGYEPQALLVYLMTIANSNYEDFIVSSKDYNLDHFKFNLKKMSLDGALFDNEKLNFYSKEILSKMDKKTISSKAYKYAKEYDKNLLNFIEKDYSRFEEIMNIERERKNPRKDYAKYSDIYDAIKYFDHDIYLKEVKKYSSYELKINQELKNNLINEYLNIVKDYSSEQEWFEDVKIVASKFNFCVDNKLYKLDSSKYNGNINDVCELIRVAITNRKVSLNLFMIMKILTLNEVKDRLTIFLNNN
ncbi:MAG: glutamate--tRNA ligase [Bacillales bacterium]